MRRTGLVCTALALLVGCEPPDRPAAAVAPLPEPAVRFLQPDTVRTVRLADGIAYRYLWSPVGPWAVHVVELDARRCGPAFAVSRAPGEPGSPDARRPVSQLVRWSDGRVVAAVNGDFFTPEGRPRGVEVSEAGVRGTQGRPAFAWDAGGGPRIVTVDRTTPRRRGDEADGEVDGAEDDDVPVALVSGFPRLLEDGREVEEGLARERPSFAGVRHPRTAVGISDDRTLVWTVVVDGRQGGYSAGMTLSELARLLESLGAADALNLDGGGSSAMVLAGRVASRPSDPEGERAVANALLVLYEAERCAGAPGRGGARRRGVFFDRVPSRDTSLDP